MIFSYRSFKRWLLHYTWDLAYGRYDDCILTKGLGGVSLNLVVNPYKNKWFADPFILDETGSELHLLVEEFDFDVKRGRIAHLTIEKVRNRITDCKIILDLPTHLSFPAIYREGDTVYVHPENSRSGKSYIYRYDIKNESLVDPVCVCEEPIADAIIVYKDCHYEMYATCDPNPNGDTLFQYEAEKLSGMYRKVSKIVYQNNVARMAGAFLATDIGLVRPAQDCNGSYGKAVLFMKGDEILSELRPNGVKFAGIHTFNTLGNTFVIDFKKYDFPLLYYLKTKLKG